MSIETVIKWYDPGTFAERPVGWYVEQADDVECDIVSNNDLGIHYGWVLTKLNKTDDKEIYFKTFLHVTVLGYREFWKHNNDIATRYIQYAVITPYTRHKTLPYVIIETESLYAPVLFRELQRNKRGLDFFHELGDETAWQELITCAKEADHTYSDKYLNYTFYSNKTPLFNYYFVLSAAFTRVPIIETAKVPNIIKFGYNFYSDSVRGKEWEELEEATTVAKRYGFLTEFPREYGIGVVDFQKNDWCKFACAFD